MDCADYCVDCDGDSDSDGNDLMHGVLNEETEVTLTSVSLFSSLGKRSKNRPRDLLRTRPLRFNTLSELVELQIRRLPDWSTAITAVYLLQLFLS